MLYCDNIKTLTCNFMEKFFKDPQWLHISYERKMLLFAKISNFNFSECIRASGDLLLNIMNVYHGPEQLIVFSKSFKTFSVVSCVFLVLKDSSTDNLS